MNLEDSKILLVGGAGLVGSHIADLLIHENVEEIVIFDNFIRGKMENLSLALQSPKVRVVKASMMDTVALDREMKGVDGVFLLASLWLRECQEEPRKAWEINTLGTWNVLETCLKHNVKRVVYSSSASVYGNALFTPMTESHPFNNNVTYGATKIANEQMFHAIYYQHGFPYIGLRYFNIYGPRMDFKGAYVSVIMKVLDRIFAGKPPIIYGDGSQVLDFIYIKDVARANILSMKSDLADISLNIASGIPTKVNDLVDMLLELTNSQLKPVHESGGESYVTERIGATELAKKKLGFTAEVSLLDGLREVVEWRMTKRSPANE